jgi:hypothetical protein
MRARECFREVAPRATAWLLTWAALAGATGVRAPPSETDSEIAALQATLGVRSVLGRIAGAPHAPPATTLAASSPGDEELERTRRRARLLVEAAERVRTRPTPADLQRRAALELLAGSDPRAALAWLDQACAAASPCGADVENDRAVAWLEVGRREHDLAAAAQALDAAQRAFAADPTSGAAGFNRALALESLSLSRAAREAWGALAASEPDPGWAAEARAHAERLDQAEAAASHDDWPRVAESLSPEDLAHAVARRPQAAREEAQDRLLPRWAERRAAGDLAGARRVLDAVAVIAAGLARLEPDELLHETLRTLTELEAHSGPALDEAVQGLRAYGRALAATDGGGDRLAAARRRLSDAGLPLALWADFHLATRAHLDGRHTEALDGYTRLRDDIGTRPFPHLRGRAERARGIQLAILGRSLEAALAYEIAAGDLARSADLPGRVALLVVQDEIWSYLGQPGRAWRARAEALEHLPRLGTRTAAQLLLDQGASALREQGLPRAARAFQDEWVERARQAGDAFDLATALGRRVETLVELGDARAAEADLRAAQAALADVLDQGLRASAQIELRLAEASLSVARAPEQALAALGEARQALSARAAAGRLPEIDLRLARAARAAGQADHARAHLERALDGYEAESRRLDGARLDDFAVGALHAATDEVVSDLARRGRGDEAFVYAERARGRILLDVWGARRPAGPAVGVPTLEQVRRALPPGHVLLVYDTLPDVALAWRVTRTGARLFRLALTRAHLERRLAPLQGGAPGRLATDALWAELHGALLAPLLAGVPRDATLVIVPDGPLHVLPFAALLDERSGRRLIEDHALVVTPSAGVFLAALGEMRRRGNGRRGLVVAPPELSPELTAELGELRAGIDEADRIAKLDPASVLIGGRNATVARFRDEAEQADWIHFAGHARVQRADPAASALLLAPDPGARGSAGAGALSLADVRSWSLARARLIVLSACGTGAGPRAQSEGLTSLGASFLLAGVPSVVASLWRVEDETTRALMLEFHRGLAAGVPPAEALRRTQLALLASDRSEWRNPRHWAAFIVLGAS